MRKIKARKVCLGDKIKVSKQDKIFFEVSGRLVSSLEDVIKFNLNDCWTKAISKDAIVYIK